jgi:hypothetical protein
MLRRQYIEYEELKRIGIRVLRDQFTDEQAQREYEETRNRYRGVQW